MPSAGRQRAQTVVTPLSRCCFTRFAAFLSPQALQIAIVRESHHTLPASSRCLFKRKVEKLETIVARQQKQIEALTAGLEKVNAQLELSGPAPQTVVGNQ